VAGFAAVNLFPAVRPLLAGAILLYVVLIAAISVKLAVVHRKPAVAFCLPLAFATRHLVYAIGSLCGILSALASPRFWGGLRNHDRAAGIPAHGIPFRKTGSR
jgi:hypothetical protein